MLALLKPIQSIIKTLHSAGTPGQVAAGIALGSALGLTPLINLHNLVIFSLLVLLNVSFGGGMLGGALFVPFGFLLDPLFDKIGLSLLTEPSLRPLWTDWTNTPVLPFTNFNNTVVLGSFVSWTVLAIPIFFAARYGVARYRRRHHQSRHSSHSRFGRRAAAGRQAAFVRSPRPSFAGRPGGCRRRSSSWTRWRSS